MIGLIGKLCGNCVDRFWFMECKGINGIVEKKEVVDVFT